MSRWIQRLPHDATAGSEGRRRRRYEQIGGLLGKRTSFLSGVPRSRCLGPRQRYPPLSRRSLFAPRVLPWTGKRSSPIGSFQRLPRPGAVQVSDEVETKSRRRNPVSHTPFDITCVKLA